MFDGKATDELIAALRTVGIEGVRSAMPAGWQYHNVNGMHMFRLLQGGERRPVAGVICLRPEDRDGATVAEVARLALGYVRVLHREQYKD